MSKGQGKFIGLKFTEQLIGDVSGMTPSPIGGYAYKTMLDVVVTASSTPSPTTASHINVIDGVLTSRWYPSASAASWLQFKMPDAVKRTGFRYYIGDTQFYPTAFNIAGSNDGSTFTTLGTFTGGTSTIGWHEYTFENSESYLYYRFNITAWTSSYPWIYEFQFLEPLGNEKAFTIIGHEYDFVPGGTLSEKIYPVTKVYAHPTEANSIVLATPDLNRFENVVGDLTVIYDGTGNLLGLGGPVLAFNATFTPIELIPKPDQNNVEHLELTAVTATSQLTTVYYTSAQTGNENLELTNVTAIATLTNVSDI